MEYQKIVNLLDKRSRSNWIEINDQSRGVYNTNSDIRFMTTVLKSSLIDAYILVKGRVRITGAGNDGLASQADEWNKAVIFKNCAPFIIGKSEINDTEKDFDKDIDIVVPMYNLIENSDNYSKTSGTLWQCYNYEPNDNLP